MFTVEPIAQTRQDLTGILDELAQVAMNAFDLQQMRVLMKRWRAMISAGTGFFLMDDAECAGILLFSTEYELRFSSFLSETSAQKLPQNVTVWLCYVASHKRNSSVKAENFLLKSAIAQLRADASVETIAVQTPALTEIDIEGTLSAIGFMNCQRVRMERRISGRLPNIAGPPGCKLETPTRDDAEELMSVIYHGYFSEVDGYLFPDISAVCSDPELFHEFLDSSAIHLSSSVIARVQGYPSGCIIALKGDVHRGGLIGVVAVVPGMRRRGLGKAMILHVLRKFREARYDSASLAVTLENLPALLLYQSLGFEETNRRTNISVWRRSVSRPIMNFRR